MTAAHHGTARRARVLLGLLFGLILATSSLVPLPARAAAVALADDGPPALETVTAEPMATWQTNGVVYAVETVGNVVYAGGNFSAVRPPGAAAGQQEVARKNIAAFDARTGALLPFSHTFRSPSYPVPSGGSYDKTCSPGASADTYTCDTVYEIRASRDGSRIYVGGDFTQVDGLARGNMAAFATSNNALLPWRVTGIAGRVRALTVTQDTVYFGGSFNLAGGVSRSRLAAADAATGDLRDWAPAADKLVITMEMSADDSTVILGGQFDTINGAAIHGLAAVSAAGVGESARWDSRPIPATSYVTDLSVAGGTVFASANGEGGGVFDGRLAADTATGQVIWQDLCLGATWAIEVADDLVYSGSHAHDCSRTSGGFGESWNVQPPAVPRYYRLLAQTKDGEYAPHIQHWFPTTNGGIVGKLGPRDLTWTGEQLWVAGEFTTVNGVAQQGLTRFGKLPAAQSARPDRPATPTAASARPGEARISWQATEDIDDPLLEYTVLRGPSTGAMSPIGTVSAASKPWLRPTVRFKDTAVTAGSTYVYQVQATDPSGRVSPRSYPATVQIATEIDPYADAVLDSDPVRYWRLSDPVGSTSVAAVVGGGGVPGSGVTFGEAGALGDIDPGNTAVRTNGTDAGTIGSADSESGPDTFSAEVWFRTSTTRGGKLLGFGSSQTGQSGSYDRHVYMRSDGRLNFGVYPGGVRTLTSPGAYNDGRWHHLVASLGADGMRLYVDGAQVAVRSDVTGAQAYTGYWRLGSDNIGGWPNVSSRSFAGDLDEFAVYDRPLTTSEVVMHRVAGSQDSTAPSTPQGLTGAAGGRTVLLSWDASTDDVAVVGYRVHRLSQDTDEPTAATLVTTTDARQVSITDVPAGTSHWKVVAVDGSGKLSEPSAAASVTVTGPAPYAEAVLADSPTLYWRLDDAAGSSTIDALAGPDGTPASGVTLGVPGAVPGSAAQTSGSGTGTAATTTASAGPQQFTAEGWFRTGTTSGGKVFGFGNRATGSSTNYDRHLYMLDDGRLVFGVYPGFAATVTSAESFNDDQWHHVAVSLGSAGMRLMVDGAVVGSDPGVTSAQDYTGYWRIGGDVTWGGTSSPYFAGTLDEFAVHDRQLTPDQVRAHVVASGIDTRAPGQPGTPVVEVSADSTSVTWSAATDNVGVTSYELHRAADPAFTPSEATRVATVTQPQATESAVPEGDWSYRVVALDAAGNRSVASAATTFHAEPPDTDPPSAPTGVATSVSATTVQVTWDAASAAAGVTGHEVHRGSSAGFVPSAATLVATVPASSGTSTSEADVPGGTWHYRVVAVDAAGNRSEPSAAASAVVVVVAPDPVEVVVDTDIDAWVDSTQPTRNYGGAWALTGDASPVQLGYLRFVLPSAPAGRTLTGATLRLRTTEQTWSGSAGALQVRLAQSSDWTETALTWDTRLALLPDDVGVLPAGFASNTAHEVTLDPAAVAGRLGGQATLAVRTGSTDGFQVVSSEGAASGRPVLVLTFG